jgi:transcriptional regulator with XRE-family HTH domain
MRKRFLEPEVLAINDQAGLEAATFAKEARASTGLSQRKFAKQARLGSNTIATIEANTSPHPPRLNTLVKIARGAGKRLKLSLAD